MVDAGGEEKTRPPLRRFLLRWGIVFALIGASFVGTIIALNSTLYSPEGFVRSYLAALARHDIESALGTPGVVVEGTARDTLLTSDGLGDLSDIRLIGQADAPDGQRTLEFGFSLDGTTATATFDIEATTPRLGFFQTWRFATSPTASITVTPVNGAQFTANGVDVDAVGIGAPTPLAVLTPAVVELAHASPYLEAGPEDILVLEAGVATAADVTIGANDEFVALVQEQLDGLLDDCATQTVLQPTGCPFGEAIRNRIEGTPEWSIASYPRITIIPGVEPGTWQVPETPGAAHLVVGVQSLFDGTRSTFDEDVPFTVGYLLTFPGDGSVSITAR